MKQKPVKPSNWNTASAADRKLSQSADSWWADPKMTREQFYDRANAKLNEMAKSPEGVKYQREWR